MYKDSYKGVKGLGCIKLPNFLSCSVLKGEGEGEGNDRGEGEGEGGGCENR